MRKFDISKFDNKEDLNIFLESDKFDYRNDVLVLNDIEIGIKIRGVPHLGYFGRFDFAMIDIEIGSDIRNQETRKLLIADEIIEQICLNPYDNSDYKHKQEFGFTVAYGVNYIYNDDYLNLEYDERNKELTLYREIVLKDICLDFLKCYGDLLLEDHKSNNIKNLESFREYLNNDSTDKYEKAYNDVYNKYGGVLPKSLPTIKELKESGKFKEFKKVAPSINNSLNKNKSNERAL